MPVVSSLILNILFADFQQYKFLFFITNTSDTVSSVINTSLIPATRYRFAQTSARGVLIQIIPNILFKLPASSV